MKNDKKTPQTPTPAPAPQKRQIANEGYSSYSENGALKNNTVSFTRPIPPAPTPPKK